MIGEELELLTMERFRESSGPDRRERERWFSTHTARVRGEKGWFGPDPCL